jgi:hypothetical protein
MIYITLKGGLGNMLFQIATGLSFAIKNNTKLGVLNLHNHITYLNDEMSINPTLKHSFEYLTLNIFNNINIIKDVNIKETELYNIINYPFEYIDIIPQNNTIIDGFFQSEKYFKEYTDIIYDNFAPTQSIIDDLKEYNFFKYKTTAIHVRRGDFIKYTNIHPIQSLDYFNKAIQLLSNVTEKFIIFSDDIEWCKLNFTGDQFIFIENEKDYNELYLMSLCDNNIISNSSFSWWGAWINKNNEKKIIAPKKWFGPANYQYSDKDIIPENWIKL